MRLGQLSRKLELPATKIIAFIEKEFEVTIPDHPNTKIDDSYLEKIDAKFKKEEPAPVKEEKVIAEEKTIEKTEIVEEVNKEIITEVAKKKGVETIVPSEDLVVESTIVEKEDVEKPIELIKAPKPELKQIKVLRTIELPKKKQTIEVSEEEKTDTQPKATAKDVAELEKELKAAIDKPTPIKKKESTYKRPNKPMKKKKSVDEILAEKKKREEKQRLIEEKKEQERLAYEKKKKKEHYQAQVANVKPKKKKKKVVESVEFKTSSTKKVLQKERPKTWIGRLILWFQTS